MPSLRRLLSVLLFAALPACSGPSVWEQTFTPAPGGSAQVRAEDAPVRVRSIPWERMQAMLIDLDRAAGATDVHPEDWSAEQKLAAKSRLLSGLQFDGAPDATRILGRSEFRTTATIIPDGPDHGSLETFARKVGATDVVWSSRVLGQTEKIVEHPVTTFDSGTFWGRGRGRHRWWDDGSAENRSTWVPVRVPADDTGFVAYFLSKD